MWCGEALRPGTGVLEALRGSVMGTGARDVEGGLFDCLWDLLVSRDMWHGEVVEVLHTRALGGGL